VAPSFEVGWGFLPRGWTQGRIAALGGRRISSIVVDGDEHAVAFWRAAGYERDRRLSRFVKNR
jgi:hypothetical protein